MMPSSKTSSTEHARHPQTEEVARHATADRSAHAEDLSSIALQKVIRELRVHQIELEMQNDELRRTQAERDSAEARYFDFYDQAPVGYVTVSEQGLILHSNLTTAAMLGVARSQLARQAFSNFIERQDQDAYYLLRKQLLESSRTQSCELRMLKHDDSLFFVRMDAIAAHGDDDAPVLRLVLIDITAQRQAEECLRIAAVAFEAQEAIIVMNSQRQILRVNQAFTEITGYSKQDALGETTCMLQSRQHPGSFYDDIWRETMKLGSCRTEGWLQHKSGADFFAHGTLTSVRDPQGQPTHYVVTFSDQTLKQQQDQQRVQHEMAHRDALVREVHHRIQNSLQGIGGLLQQFAIQQPEIAEQMQLVAGHLKGISIIHGLQGRHDKSRVQLCELMHAIAQAASTLWQTEVTVDIPDNWVSRVLAEKEAVSMALVLNELLVNALKHGGKAHGHVRVTLRQGPGLEGVELSMFNAGKLHNNQATPTQHHHGLQLIESLRPREGLTVTLAQRGDQVHTLLKLTPPVLSLDT